MVLKTVNFKIRTLCKFPQLLCHLHVLPSVTEHFLPNRKTKSFFPLNNPWIRPTGGTLPMSSKMHSQRLRVLGSNRYYTVVWGLHQIVKSEKIRVKILLILYRHFSCRLLSRIDVICQYFYNTSFIRKNMKLKRMNCLILCLTIDSKAKQYWMKPMLCIL